jgi:hypothetical protein
VATGPEHNAEADSEKGLHQQAHTDGAPDPAPAFFQTGRAYRHGNARGSEEGLFWVKYVGTAPGPFEYHSELLGVAFGWRWGLGPNGDWEGLGSYSTPDFAGWEEVPPPPCGAAVGNSWVCAEPRDGHLKHVAENGDYWFEADPCRHDDCSYADCDPTPTVHCGFQDESGHACCFIARHRRDHEFPAA